MKVNYRSLAAALPLPMLSLAASYGVYTFGLLYLPIWVSFVMAASFEAVYIGLAAMELKPNDRKRASAISKGAVGVSIVYNVIAGVLHRRPEWFSDLNVWYEWLLAVIHGAPLALLCYLVADLVIHRQSHMHETISHETKATETLKETHEKHETKRAFKEALTAQAAHEPKAPRRETIALGSFPDVSSVVSARVAHEPQPEARETLEQLLELPQETQTEIDERFGDLDETNEVFFGPIPLRAASRKLIAHLEQQRETPDFVSQLALGVEYPTSQLIELIGKSRAQSNRIIGAAVDNGTIEQVQRGLYRRKE